MKSSYQKTKTHSKNVQFADGTKLGIPLENKNADTNERSTQPISRNNQSQNPENLRSAPVITTPSALITKQKEHLLDLSKIGLKHHKSYEDLHNLIWKRIIEDIKPQNNKYYKEMQGFARKLINEIIENQKGLNGAEDKSFSDLIEQSYLMLKEDRHDYRNSINSAIDKLKGEIFKAYTEFLKSHGNTLNQFITVSEKTIEALDSRYSKLLQQNANKNIAANHDTLGLSDIYNTLAGRRQAQSSSGNLDDTSTFGRNVDRISLDNPAGINNQTFGRPAEKKKKVATLRSYDTIRDTPSKANINLNSHSKLIPLGTELNQNNPNTKQGLDPIQKQRSIELLPDYTWKGGRPVYNPNNAQVKDKTNEATNNAFNAQHISRVKTQTTPKNKIAVIASKKKQDIRFTCLPGVKKHKVKEVQKLYSSQSNTYAGITANRPAEIKVVKGRPATACLNSKDLSKGVAQFNTLY